MSYPNSQPPVHALIRPLLYGGYHTGRDWFFGSAHRAELRAHFDTIGSGFEEAGLAALDGLELLHLQQTNSKTMGWSC